MWGTAWDRYGRTFADTFARYWPASVDLVIVTDRPLPTERARQIPLCDGSAAFKARWAGDRLAEGFDSGFRKLDGDGRSWRHNAVKWAPQGFAPIAALDGMNDGDLFVWFDADVETIAPVPEGWIEGLIGNHDVACLQRPRQHSEIGFYAMRLGPRTRKVLDRFAWFYASDRVFTLEEWHSAFVWDRALESVPGLKVRNLNPRGKGHVWPNTPLAELTLHKKGKLK